MIFLDGDVMKHVIITMLILGIMIVGLAAEIKIEESLIKTTAAETTTEAVTVQTTEAVIETTTEPTTEAETVTETVTVETEAQAEEVSTVEEARLSLISKMPKKRQYIGKFYITGYTAEEGFPEGSATASGVGAKPGICALNNSQRRELGIDYGDTIYIDGLGEFTVADCGCAYGVVDVWVYTNAEAYSMTGYYEVYK